MKYRTKKFVLQESKCLTSAKNVPFPLKNIHLYSLWYLAALKTTNIRAGVILALSFADDTIFLKALLF